MAVSFVANATNFGTGTTQTCSFSPNPTTGNGLVCCIGTADVTATISSISDTLTNNWISIGSQVGNGLATFFYYVKQCKPVSGTNTVSVTVNTSGGLLELNLFEVAPGAGATSILFDLFTGGTDPDTPAIGPTPSLSAASEFAITYGVVGGNVVAISTAGWNEISLASTTDDLLGYQVTTAATPLSVAWTYGGSPAFAGAIVTFKGVSTGNPQAATDAIAAAATMPKNIAAVIRRANDPITAKATITPVAKHIANAKTTI